MKLNSQLVLAIVLVTSCMNIWAEDQQTAECANAKEEIAKLKEQKQSTGGLLSKTPIGMVAKAGQSKEKKQKRKEIKEQNKAIDAQIDAIREKCDLE